MRRGPEDPAEREVEELLKAAQDDLLLKITVNRTFPSPSLFSDDPSYSLDPNLARRFQALKSGKTGAQIRTKMEADGVIGDELAARFSALKGGDSSTISVNRESALDDESDDEEKEVEKVVQWAMDAVRLDLISNEEKGNLSEELEEDGDSDLEELGNEETKTKKKENPDSKKPPKKKWFIF